MSELSILIHHLKAGICSLEARGLAYPRRRRRHSRLYLQDLNIFLNLHGQRIVAYDLHGRRQRARRAVIGRTSAARSSEATSEGGSTSEEKKHPDGLRWCTAALSGCCGIIVGDHRPLNRPGVPEYPAVKPKRATADRGFMLPRTPPFSGWNYLVF